MKFFKAIMASAALAVAAGETIVELAVQDKQLKFLVQALGATGLTDLLNGDGEFTVFAPGRSAFKGTVAEFLMMSTDYSRDLLREVLTNHVLAGKVLSSQLPAPGQPVSAASGSDLTFNAQDLTITSGDVTVNLKANKLDMEVDNGVVHRIQGLLLPSTVPTMTLLDAVRAGNLVLLEEALAAIGLTNRFDRPRNTVFTVFAPTDAAFQQVLDTFGISKQNLFNDKVLKLLLEYILRAHIVEGSALMASDLGDTVPTLSGSIPTSVIKTVATDIKTLNGVAHVIEEVIIPDFVAAAFAERAAVKGGNQGSQGADDTILAAAESTESLSTLVTALRASGLDDAAGDASTDITVFAPTDSAFAAVSTVLPYLLGDNEYQRGLLTAVLQNHIVSGGKIASELSSQETTALGETLTFDLVAAPPVVTTADGVASQISGVDAVDASNGIVHVVDTVLLPMASKLPTSINLLSVVLDNGEDADGSNSAGILNVLKLLLVATGKAGTFGDANGNAYTVFAPTNAAFAELLTELGVSFEQVAQLIADNETFKGYISELLDAHVVLNHVLFAEDVIALASQNKRIKVERGSVDAKTEVLDQVVATDFTAYNGVAHVIGRVIRPTGTINKIVEFINHL